MKRPWALLSAFLLLGLGSASYLWWRLSDEQVLLRRIDALCETVSVRQLSLGDAERPLEIFRTLIGDPVTLSGDPEIPSGTFTEEETVKQLQRFREMVKSSRLRRLDTAISFPAANEAAVEALMELEVSWLGGSRTVDKFRAQLLFERTPEGWILTLADFRQAPGK